MYTDYFIWIVTASGALVSIHAGSSRYISRACIADLLRLARSRHVAAFCTVSTSKGY